MIARPRHLEPVPAAPGATPVASGETVGHAPALGTLPGETDPIANWLDILCSLLRLPANEQQSVRDELENHLRERVRDLIVTGTPESQATGAAIDELGDAAALAREFRTARRTPIRRALMNLAVIGLAAGAAVTSLVALTHGLGPQSANVSVFQPPATVSQAPRVTIHFEGTHDMPWGEFFGAMGKMAKMPVFVHWTVMSGLVCNPPIEEGSEAHFRLNGDFTLDSAVEFLNDDLGLDPDNRIDFRVRDGRLVFATTAFFDRQETVLATYDLTDLVNQRNAKAAEENSEPGNVVEEVTHLITTLVHSEQWSDNGGDRASLTHYGSKLFVKAPKRFQPQIQWILTEVGTGGPEAKSRRATPKDADSPVVRTYHLKHTPAEDTLNALKKLQSIRKVDFTPFASDPRTNSIVGQATPPEHDLIARALVELDNPEHVLNEARRADLKAMGDDLRQRLPALTTKCAEAEKQIVAARQQYGDEHRTTKKAEANLAAVQEQAATVRAELDKVEAAARQLEASRPN